MSETIIDWQKLEIPKEVIPLIPVESIERYRFFPFDMSEEVIKVAVVDDSSLDTQNALRFFGAKEKKQIELYQISEEDFVYNLVKFKNPEFEIGKALDVLEQVSQKESQEKEQRARSKEVNTTVLQEAPVAKMVEVIIKNALDGRASDIHIEPMENAVRVRYRVDGSLYNSITLPNKVGPAIVSRIKILSNLKIDEKRKPQDGRFRITDLGKTIDFRVSTFPVSNGEKVVMRILDKNEGIIDLDNLGLFGRDQELLRKTIEEPFGIILVTGPTGSGKSTTLYAVLNILNREGVNIVTLEDPVEYVLEGISQSQVKPEIGYTFASGLRSILRQDPDIVMVGEIRDSETAELSIHAALTGHLVLSTLHTNSAIGAVPRLIDMGVQGFLIASSLKLVMGQRLVRRICPNCREKVANVSPAAIQTVTREIAKISDEVLAKLNIDRNNLNFYRGKGCVQCHNNGMKGRIGIYEVMEITDNIIQMITDRVKESEIEREARKNGYTTMKEEGILKVLVGLTTLEEVQRVTEDSSLEEVIQAKGE